MLDENLPAFYLKSSPDQIPYHRSYYLTYRGSDPEPAYELRNPDPASPSGRNCYAAALFDSFNPEVLFGEVLIRPEWTQPTLSQEDIRRNGGIPPAPQPILPGEFTVQLYNPDQQIVVREKKGGWGGAPSYTFSMPQQTFRMPSVSALDRQLDDPSANHTTPQINFQWKREGKLSKDMACYMTGKSNDVIKRKHREPDIIVGMFQALREITIYESNYHRIEIEDPKGLEVVLLLSAAVLKDVYFTPLREAFNVGDGEQRTMRKHSSSINLFNGGLQRKPSPLDNTHLAVPTAPAALSAPPTRAGPVAGASSAAMGGLYAPPPSTSDDRRKSLPQLRTSSAPPLEAQPPPADPRTQWAIDNETARLRAASDAQRRANESARREQEKLDAAEAKRLQKQMEAEEKERRKQQAIIDKETERLRKKYGDQTNMLPPLPPRQQGPYGPGPSQQQWPSEIWTGPQQHSQPPPPVQQQPGWHTGPYIAPQASQSSMFGSNGLPLRPAQQMKPKKSFWGLGSSSRDMSGALPPDDRQRNLIRRKSSSVF